MIYIKEYFNSTELPNNLKNKKLIKFEGYKNNDKAEGHCIVGYMNMFDNYYYEEVNFINDRKNGPYKKYFKNKICEEGIYKNDLKNGPYKIYYKNSNITEGIYKNGIKMK